MIGLEVSWGCQKGFTVGAPEFALLGLRVWGFVAFKGSVVSGFIGLRDLQLEV